MKELPNDFKYLRATLSTKKIAHRKKVFVTDPGKSELIW